MPAHESTLVNTTWPRPRRFGRILMTVIIMLAVQGGIFWQLHRSFAAKRRQVAMEMQDFETRAQALRSNMEALQGRLGEAQGKFERLQALPAPSAPPSRPAAPVVGRPLAQSTRPRPPRPPAHPAPRPAPIVLDPGCAKTPLGC
ncbi:MAG TPA: hypothetical protein VNM90_18430 [Haliangium sp.]|nr:hypothetical protein [Haliangium sp.]